MKRIAPGVCPLVRTMDLDRGSSFCSLRTAAIGASLFGALAVGCAAADNGHSAFDADGGASGGGSDRADAGEVRDASLDGGWIVISPSLRDAGQDSDASCSREDGCKELVGCGNGRIDPGHGEACDDGNTRAGDGCSSDCTLIETGFACPEPGQPCVSTVRCGDGILAGGETCDDGNTENGDGCSSGCSVENGYQCASGSDCTPICGDGILKGAEQCDPPYVGNGCAADCRLEPGFICTQPLGTPDAGATHPTGAEGGTPLAPDSEAGVPSAQCRRTQCGDGHREGAEACDDGNTVDGDGCSASCRFEPDCSSGSCVSKCGDGLLLAPEQCDDGNTIGGDGCSSDCKVEAGWSCAEQSQVTPEALNLQVVFRDFNSIPVEVDGGPSMDRHPDYEADWSGDQPTPGLVLTTLDAEGKPVLSGCCTDTAPSGGVTCSCAYGQMMTGQSLFAQWYRDTPGVNLAFKASLVLPRQSDGSYLYDSNNTRGFFPLDGKGWVAAGKEETSEADPDTNDGKYHNFGFSSEVRYFFKYRGAEQLTFSGDDDVWVFINRRLALDLGGLHPRRAGTLTVDNQASTLGLVKGGLYEMVLFHAERHTSASNFRLTLTGFAPTYSTCHSVCGDGVVAGGEQCDPGTMTPADAGPDAAASSDPYGRCSSDCKRGPRCGDQTVQTDHEQCDDGINLTLYSSDGQGCAPGCHRPARCGDGQVDALFGEECDNGASNRDGLYGGCTVRCLWGPHCGDGIVQAPEEQCDDGNRLTGDGCDSSCTNEITK